MSDSKQKILEMLAKGKISSDDAYRLLSVLEGAEGSEGNDGEPARAEPVAAGRGKYLRVTITPGDNPEGTERVNVRVPMSLIRAGLKLTSLVPPDALDKANQALHDKGINFDVRNIKSEDIEELIDALGDMEVDIEGRSNEKIKVFVE